MSLATCHHGRIRCGECAEIAGLREEIYALRAEAELKATLINDLGIYVSKLREELKNWRDPHACSCFMEFQKWNECANHVRLENVMGDTRDNAQAACAHRQTVGGIDNPESCLDCGKVVHSTNS